MPTYESTLTSVNLSSDKSCSSAISSARMELSQTPLMSEKVKEYPVPESVKDVYGFLGLASYYRKFIQNFTQVAEPLHKLLHKNATFQWSSEVQQCFEYLKDCLISEPILQRPDFTKQFILHTDASDFGIGAVLSQFDDNKRE